MCVRVFYRGRGVEDKSLCLSLTVLSTSHLPLSDAGISRIPVAHSKLSIHPACFARHLIPGCCQMSDHVFQPIIKQLLA